AAPPLSTLYHYATLFRSRALGQLKEQGLIDSQVGRGTFVAGQKHTPTRMRNVLVLSHEQQSDRADELTRLMHRAFLQRDWRSVRSEEHTSELQSRGKLVC